MGNGGYRGVSAEQSGDFPPNPEMLSNIFPTSGLLSMLPPEMRTGRINQLFMQGFSFLTLGASATLSTNITVQSDADFVICFGMCQSTSSDNLTLQQYVPQLVQWRDNGLGLNLMDTALPFNLVYGDAQNPGCVPMPYIIRRNGTLQIQHQNLEATARNVRGAMVGFRSWNDPSYIG
jgi:hypothetical protein